MPQSKQINFIATDKLKHANILQQAILYKVKNKTSNMTVYTL